MNACIHFCSTPRNLYLSIGQLLQYPDYQHHLLLLDQSRDKRFPLFDALSELPELFTSVTTLFKGKGHKGKRSARILAFESLNKLLNQLRPSLVFVGNDRRLEFQYFMHKASQQKISCKAMYLEDGVNSYLSAAVIRKKWRPFADKYLEPLVKKATYGMWYDRKQYVGCSRWVDTRLLTFPELLSESAGPRVETLDCSTYTSPAFVAVVKKLLGVAHPQSGEYSGQLLMLMPHSQDILADYTSEAKFLQHIEPMLKKYTHTYVKYHPNESNFILHQHAQALPHKLPMEMLLSVCKFDAYVGNTSAALLNIKWLFPTASVFSVDNGQSASRPLFELLQKANIEIVSDYSKV